MADAQATMTEAQVDDQPVTQTRLTQRRGRAPTEAREHFIGPEQPNWDAKDMAMHSLQIFMGLG